MSAIATSDGAVNPQLVLVKLTKHPLGPVGRDVVGVFSMGLVFRFQCSLAGLDRAPLVLGDQSDTAQCPVEMPDVLELHIQLLGRHAGVIRAAAGEPPNQLLAVRQVPQGVQLALTLTEKPQQVIAVPRESVVGVVLADLVGLFGLDVPLFDRA